MCADDCCTRQPNLFRLFLFVIKCKGIIVAPIIHTPWPNSTFQTIFSFTPFSKHWQGGIYIETRTGFVIANTFFIAIVEKEIISVSLQLWEQRIKIVSASHLSQSAAAKTFQHLGFLSAASKCSVVKVLMRQQAFWVWAHSIQANQTRNPDIRKLYEAGAVIISIIAQYKSE